MPPKNDGGTRSNRSEAVRLSVLLDTLLKTDAGGWDEQCHVYDSTFAEAILQVANHCIERGALLQRIRKFFQIVMRSEREAREAARKAREVSTAVMCIYMPGLVGDFRWAKAVGGGSAVCL